MEFHRVTENVNILTVNCLQLHRQTAPLTYSVSPRFDSSSSAHYPLRRGRDDPFPVPPSTRT